VVIGVLLKTEPLYIQGVDYPDAAAENCFVAAGIYAFFVVATSIVILRNKQLGSGIDAHREVDGDAAEYAGIAKESRFGGGYGSSTPTRSATLNR